MTAVVQGASGGEDASAGRGGVSRLRFPVQAGDILTLAVGEQGSVGDTVGTYGGGGPVRAGSHGTSGGGGSFIFGEDQHLVVAAGGGGGYAGLPAGRGGAGGGASGGDGVGYPDSIYAYTGATGGTSTAGGTGGQFFLFGSVYGSAGTAGTGPADTDGPGRGGRGGNSVGEEYGGGGGGGGGYGGGAGGHYQGAGGGSGYSAPGLVSSTSTATHTGDGLVTLTWTKAKAVVTAPRITTSVASPTPKSTYGWYRSAVTVRFSCTATSAPVVSCPKPVVLKVSGARTVKRSVTAEDGGTATVSVTVKIDRGAPRVWIKGARAGATFTKIPSVHCVTFENYSGRYSGLASCSLTRKVTATKKPKVRHVTWTATATDKAGNVTRKTKTVRLVTK
ncbi:glycine-rich protein [Jatrophihabitans fulvus]